MLIDIETPYEGHLERIQLGLYHLLSWDAERAVLEKDFYVFDHQWPEYHPQENALKALSKRFKEKTYFSEYGSCDSPEQFLAHAEYGQLLVRLPEKFCVTFHYMSKADYGDRRWHKHGPHIGAKKPEYEHFGDETEINEIYSFHIYRLKSG
jgi:hypothetical protein